jgi:hypothetical protein
MKTPMQELIDEMTYMLTEGEPSIYALREKARKLLEKEKEIMLQYGNDICCPHHGDENDALYVWNQTFNTNEK